MRVISGKFRGRRLQSPPGLETRPTSDRVREALFSILRDRVEGARFLDGYAGTGAVGIEALSRGASRCVFVESGGSVAVLRGNLEALGVGDEAVVLTQSFVKAAAILGRGETPFDIVFLDPPYGPGELLRALRLAATEGFLSPSGILVAQHPTRLELPEAEGRLARARQARYGNTTLSFFSEASSTPVD